MKLKPWYTVCPARNQPAGASNTLAKPAENFQKRLNEHLEYINGKVLSQPTGHHFNLPGHMQCIGHKGDNYRALQGEIQHIPEVKKSFYISQFNTLRKGMNKKS